MEAYIVHVQNGTYAEFFFEKKKKYFFMQKNKTNYMYFNSKKLFFPSRDLTCHVDAFNPIPLVPNIYIKKKVQRC